MSLVAFLFLLFSGIICIPEYNTDVLTQRPQSKKKPTSPKIIAMKVVSSKFSPFRQRTQNYIEKYF
jgi:hypothetical protein